MPKSKLLTESLTERDEEAEEKEGMLHVGQWDQLGSQSDFTAKAPESGNFRQSRNSLDGPQGRDVWGPEGTARVKAQR